MVKYIDAEKLKKRIEKLDTESCASEELAGFYYGIDSVLKVINSLQQEQPITEDWAEKRKQECPFRKNLYNNLYGCSRYEGAISLCDGRCSWIVDYPKLKELKERKQKYTLELTKEQYYIIAMCTEVVHRISVGQVEELNQIVCKSIDRELLVKVKEQAFPELSYNASYKWCGGHPSKSFSHFQAATYAIYREMLHFRVVHEGRDSVYQSPTLRCEGIDIPKITLNDNLIQEKQEDEK